MKMKRLIVFIGVSLLCLSAFAARPNYSDERAWVERHNATNSVPKDERLFVTHNISGDYTCIVHYHKGISLREVIDQTPFKATPVYVIVMRPVLWMSPYIFVKPSEKPDFEIKPFDVIWMFDKPRAFK
jgi:hypothetical protein